MRKPFVSGRGLSAEEFAVVLVGQALDDLAAGRIDVAGALELVATIAWRQGHDVAAGQRPRAVVWPEGPVDPPVVGSGDEYIVLIADPATGEADAEGPLPGVAAMVLADRVRLELNASGLVDFTVTLTPLRRPC